MSETLSNESVELSMQEQSPVQEQHVDFLLEEEFAANPDFLAFFISAARGKESERNGRTKFSFPEPDQSCGCIVIRSVLAGAGETDVLVIYKSKDRSAERVAILIEDKIRAPFQDEQPQRYRLRGQQGLKDRWEIFWTCLVAPSKYAATDTQFDARIDLEELRGFFANGDRRAQFKAAVLDRALHSFAASGVKRVDPEMTAFRQEYAKEAEKRFHGLGVRWDLPRKAWFGDTWFTFRSNEMPKRIAITHKALAGLVHLSFSHTHIEALEEALESCRLIDKIGKVQTGKSASLQQVVTPILCFRDFEANRSAIDHAFHAITDFLHYWQESGSTIFEEAF